MGAKRLNLKSEEKVDAGGDGIESLLKAVKRDIRKDFDISKFEDTEQEWLSTGVASVNYAFSGRTDGGFPVGRLSELAGLNSTGKSLLAQHALVETQKKGGIAILIDSEFAFNPEWYQKLGGDPDALIHFEPEFIEQAYQFVDDTVKAIRKHSGEVPITVVYDSIAASPSHYEFEGDMSKFDMGKRAIAHGKGIRLITGLCSKQNVTFIGINQYRATMAMYGPDKDTTGGQGWKYHCSLRVDMKKSKVIEQKTEVGKKTIGIAGSLKVTKNRMRSPFATANFDIYWDQGIDPISGLFDVLVEEGAITPRVSEDTGKVSKGWWTYKDDHFQQSKFPEIIEKYPELTGGHALIEVPDDISIVEYEDSDETDSPDADM